MAAAPLTLADKAVHAVWEAMGLAQPAEPVGPETEFELDGTPIRIVQDPDGLNLRLVADLGVLPADPFSANDALRRVLRLALPLAAFNPAVVTLPAGRDRAHLENLMRKSAGAPAMVQATIVLTDPAGAPDALQDLMQWRHYVADILDSAGGDTGAESVAAPAAPDPPDMIIFQP